MSNFYGLLPKSHSKFGQAEAILQNKKKQLSAARNKHKKY